MFMVGDAKSMPPGRVNVFGGRIDKMIADGLVFEVDTLEELAKLIGVPVDAFVAQMERYNADIAAGIDDEFGKIGRKPIVTPPFHAAGPTVPILHHTMGGVKIDVYTRVIDVHGRPIPGLYAAGEVTGGIHGTNRLGSNALTDIFVFGRIAGESAAGGR